MKTKIFLFLIFIITVTACNLPAMHITVYNKGVSDKVEFTAAQEKKILDILKELYEKADKIVSPNVAKTDIANIKSKDRCVEIILDVSYSLNNSAIGNSIINKILIPLSGSFGGDIKKGGINFFAGLDEYNGKQYLNSSGFKYVGQIYQELQR
jgi:hypothetical protein